MPGSARTSAGNRHNVTCGHFALLRRSETTSKDREVAASHHGDTPYSGTSHISTGYPIRHFRGREREHARFDDDVAASGAARGRQSSNATCGTALTRSGRGASSPVPFATKQHSRSSARNAAVAMGWSKVRRYRASGPVSGCGRRSGSVSAVRAQVIGGVGHVVHRGRIASLDPMAAPRDPHLIDIIFARTNDAQSAAALMDGISINVRSWWSPSARPA